MKRMLALSLPVLAALVLYAPTLRYERTFDDVHQVAAPGVAETRSLSDVWSQPYWGTVERGGLYRPILSTTFWLEGKADLPLPVRHAVNVLLHAAVTFLLVRLLLALGLGAASRRAGRPSLRRASGARGSGRGPGGARGIVGGVLDAARLGPSRPRRRTARGDRMGGGARLSRRRDEGERVGASLLRRRSRYGARPKRAGGTAGVGGLRDRDRRASSRSADVLGGWLNAPGATVTPFDNPLAALHGVDRLLDGLRVGRPRSGPSRLPGHARARLLRGRRCGDGEPPRPEAVGWGSCSCRALAAALWGAQPHVARRPAALVGAVWVLAPRSWS